MRGCYVYDIGFTSGVELTERIGRGGRRLEWGLTGGGTYCTMISS